MIGMSEEGKKRMTLVMSLAQVLETQEWVGNKSQALDFAEYLVRCLENVRFLHVRSP